uniref:Uncharacterized protein n=1 Tax=Candidatus Kentrum sp. TC TaxID=2126339 RepID=A0A450YPE7_9GAMM|nr:MAG: hypothetical protein BECKTC1821E_GA0114239_102511 [Candidatus Kentron sp. TC]
MAKNEIDALFEQLGKQKDELNQLSSDAAKPIETQAVGASFSSSPNYNPAVDEGLWLSGMIMGFALILIAFMTYVIRKGADLDDTLKVFGTILIVVAAVFLIVAGYSEKQIAPVIGLLGTVAGYILGKQHSNKKSANNPIQPTPKDGAADG